MKAPATSALWAAVITTVSAVVPLTGARAPWLAILALPSFPGYALAFFFGLGSNIEGFPDPTNIAVHLLTFAVWWGLIHFALARWRERRARTQWPPLP